MKKQVLDMRGLSPAETRHAQALLQIYGFSFARHWVRCLKSIPKEIIPSVSFITTPKRESAFYRMYKQYERSKKNEA